MSTPLFDPAREPEVAPEDAIAIVHAFLRRCLAWAEEREIPSRSQALADEPDAAGAARLHAWISYRDMTRHALHELETGTLDRWFRPPAQPRGSGCDGDHSRQ